MTREHDNNEPAGASREQLLAEVERLRLELARVHRLAMLGTLAGAIAHEFNNLLTPVMSYSEMALATPADRKLTEKALQRAIQGCDRGSRIATAILAFAGNRSKRSVTSAPEDGADVSAAVRDAMLCLAQDPTRMGVEVQIEIEPGVRTTLGQVPLQQVILNLVLNAMKAMRGRGGVLSIRATTDTGSGGCSTWNTSPVVIEVSDTGCGIEPDRMAQIFDPFVTHLASETPGTGLGLTICKQLIEEAGGRIEVESQVSVGTTFTMTLPAAAPSGALRASA